MTTGSFEGNTTRDVASSDRPVGVLANYKALWALLLFGWIVSYADRTLTGPVVAWMIQNKAGFIGDSANPAALGGLVGSMFFLGYMLTQYPGGRLGDRFGHREMIIVSLLWAAVLPPCPAWSPGWWRSWPRACSRGWARASSTRMTAR